MTGTLALRSLADHTRGLTAYEHAGRDSAGSALTSAALGTSSLASVSTQSPEQRSCIHASPRSWPVYSKRSKPIREILIRAERADVEPAGG